MNLASPISISDPSPQTAARLVLVDGSGYIFRAYHALPPLTRADGTAVGAVYGFTTMLMKLREQYAKDYLVVIFDAGRKSFRNDIYADYKAHRPPPPDDLIPQFALVREATRALNLPAIELEGMEADDLIASYAHAARAQAKEVVIISSDKDFMQLIGEGIAMHDPMKNKPIGEKEVFEKFGVTPDKVIEVQALIGDSVDNVPGVPGIGPKTAADLIGQFGTLENLLANLEQIKQPKRRELLTAHAENARLSRILVELKCDLALPESLESFALNPIDQTQFTDFLRAQSFNALLRRLGAEPAPITAPTHPVSTALQIAGEAPSIAAPVATEYTTIRDEAALVAWLQDVHRTGVLALDTETTSLNATEADLVGISLATAVGRACYIPVGHVGEKVAAQTNLFDAPAGAGAVLLEGQLPLAKVLEILNPILLHPQILKVGHNLKYDLAVLTKYNVAMHPIADTMLMHYCLNAGGLQSHGLDGLVMQHFGHKMIAFGEVVGTGKAQKNFSQIEIEPAAAYAAEDADFTLRLYEKFAPEIPRAQVATVYDTIERPLIPVIAAMENAGIRVDPNYLKKLSSEFALKMAALEEEIIALAGMPFSVGSPKQLGEVLFEKLQLPGGKKSAKSGAYTTDAETLEILSLQGHPIASKVLEWRQFSKLKSTYTDALVAAISPKDQRVHTSYSMVGASTGRLSSSDPNLQNIPIRTDEGKRIRAAFIAAEGCQLISADYSQIELRLLAHVADIPSLKEAFRNGIDIHAVTASQMFGVPVEQVTGELRRRAKTINFGIIYGISAHGLAARLAIPRGEAASYIESYFKQYPGIREYMDRTIDFARTHGFVTTLYGRKIHFREIASKNAAMRQFQERAAINAPLQGTAADIIKRAMVQVDQLVRKETASRLLLQVHDELIVEAPESQAQALAQRVKKVMEQAAELSIPLTVDVGVGNNWGEIH